VDITGAAAFWMVVAIAAAIIEIAIPQFGLIFATVGAAAAALVSLAGFGTTGQVLVFAVVLGVSLALLRPRLISRFSSRGVPTRTAPLIGRDGVVTHDIDPTLGTGRVNVSGEDWAAKAVTSIPTGTRIRVMAADGIVLEVVPQ
jgi:membrane protein implicated in regulation of membrane protease activity